ncbi:copper resistance CopC family protein [Nocardiopsis suaedae]|uniref:Copper resistance protein CopC n=1 Tax=Nocardiopsis suaedae TaxID=3018444 RepID=A0ABT4TUD8_9ACTN|nr:copper resistance CopC family protein [Nocardiopsis suaedae]MDA2807859.1 copper resistance protein CopC [Nocardiopsis suaedae]
MQTASDGVRTVSHGVWALGDDGARRPTEKAHRAAADGTRAQVRRAPNEGGGGARFFGGLQRTAADHGVLHGLLHILRTGLLAFGCTAVAWFGHAAWGGAPAPAWAVVAAGALLWGPLARFTHARRGFGAILTVMAGAQVPLHLVFLAAEAVGGVPHAAHATAHAHGVLGYSPDMLAGHLLAALIGAALVAWGEGALWALLGVLSGALPWLVVPAAVPPAGAAATGTSGPPGRAARHAPLTGVRPRGPPPATVIEESQTANGPKGPTTMTTLFSRTTAPGSGRTRRAAALTGAFTGALAAATALGLATAPAVSAHDVLLSSTPENGDELDTAPETVELTFSADIGDGGNAIAVNGPDGSDHASGDITIDGPDAAIGVEPLTEAGDYTIAYRMVSSDGHVIEDTVEFSLTEEAVADQEAEASGDDAEGEAAGTGGGGGTEAADESPAEEAPPSTDPVSMFGPVGGAIIGIAVLALVVILIIRMRNRPGGKD